MSGKRIYFENLDGLRFICFALIFFYHGFATEYQYIVEDPTYHFLKYELFSNGNLGVNFFFVLSGFLITYLLIQEKRNHGRIHLVKFWMRRILRIWPVYFFAVFFGFIIFPYFKTLFGEPAVETAEPIYYLTFLSNFDVIINNLPDCSVLGVLWSVAIEEQFYLVWPIILLIFPVRHYWIPFLVVIITSVILRYYNDTYMFREYHTFSCMGDLALGALGAWLISQKLKFVEGFKNMPRFVILSVWILFILFLVFRDEYVFPHIPLRAGERMIFGVIVLFIILEQNFSEKSLFKFSNWKRVSYLGTISYGLYCYHFIAILVVLTLTNMFDYNTQVWQVLVLETGLSFVLAVLIATISYKYYERPFLHLKKKFTLVKSGKVIGNE